MPAVICLAGPAGEEKSLLMDSLAAAFSGRGLKLGVITQAEAAPGTDPPTLDEMLARHFAQADLVLSELYPEARRVKVEYCPAGAAPRLLGDPGLKALVSPEPLEAPVPCFAPGQAEALAAHLLERSLPPLPIQDLPKVRILVDGAQLPAKDFVQDLVNGTIRALIGSLKGGDQAGRIEIHLY